MLRARLPLAAPLLLLFAACQAETHVPQHMTDQLPGRGLAVAQPADVAVAPVRDTSGAAVPLDAMRQALYEGLVDRLYSPVSLEYVDRQWTDASFGGGGAAEAVLEVTVTKWDTTHVPQRGVGLARGEARLIDAKTPDGAPLRAVGVTRRLDLGGPLPAAGWEERAAGLLALELLAELPERDPVAAHR
ncbi:MAG: hypothetical protein L0027_16105 [Candidatus Rokubacteria bacterium]|nr:hypothetical protein [Candidatus Rokubacteria bacterium]